MTTCHICESRRPRRFCPGVRGDICSQCCGTEREVTVMCPFECEYLQEARERERVPEVGPEDIPNRDIEITERFLQEHDDVVRLASGFVLEGAVTAQGAVDNDVREALETLIKTYRTLESGLYYESRPANPIAAAIQHVFQQRMNEARQQLARQTGVNTVRDSDVLGAIVFLQRLEYHHNNGRRRGRAFINFLHDYFARAAAARQQGGGTGPAPSSLILP